MDVNSGLKNEFYVCDTPKEQVKADLERSFGLINKPVPNPKRAGPAERTCYVLQGGLCSQDPVAQRAGHFTQNLYKMCFENDLGKNTFPLLLKLSVGGPGAPEENQWDSHVERFCFLLDTHGKGEVSVVMPVGFELLPDGVMGYTPHYELNEGFLAAWPVTLNLFLRSFFESLIVPPQPPGAWTAVKSIRTTLSPLKAASVPRCCFQMDGDAVEDLLSLCRSAKPVPKPKTKPGAGPITPSPFGVDLDDVGGEEGEEGNEEGCERDSDGGDDAGAALAHEQELEEVTAAGDGGDAPGGGDEGEPSHPLMGHLGVLGLEFSPSDRAACWVCGDRIPTGVWRLRYKMKRGSTAMRDTRFIHPLCTGEVPIEHFEVNDVSIKCLLLAIDKQAGPERAGERAALLQAQSKLRRA